MDRIRSFALESAVAGSSEDDGMTKKRKAPRRWFCAARERVDIALVVFSVVSSVEGVEGGRISRTQGVEER